MLESVKGVEIRIIDEWCCVVGDNTAVLPAAGKLLELKYPKLFYNGCRTHCSDLTVEDVAKIAEFELVIEDCMLVVKFVLAHSKIKEAYLRITKELGKGTTLKLFSEKRFAQICKTLESLLGKEDCNMQVLQQLILEDQWAINTAGIGAAKVEALASLVRCDIFFRRIRTLRRLFDAFSAWVHHQETAGCRASFVLPLFNALILDVDRWAAATSGNDFQAETLTELRTVVRARWKGNSRRNIVGLYAPQHLMASILDPVLCVDSSLLPDDWKAECQKIVERFYPGVSQTRGRMAAMKELSSCVLRQGSFGKEASFLQKELTKAVGKCPSRAAFGHVAHEIKRQKTTLDLTEPANLWKLELAQEFPALQDIAVRLMQMGTQSADVERCCKVNKIVHTKVRNRLAENNVKMLVYCYVNLRLLKGSRAPGRGTMDAADQMEDFLGDALEQTLEPESDDDLDSDPAAENLGQNI